MNVTWPRSSIHSLTSINALAQLVPCLCVSHAFFNKGVTLRCVKLGVLIGIKINFYMKISNFVCKHAFARRCELRPTGAYRYQNEDLATERTKRDRCNFRSVLLLLVRLDI